VALAGARYRQPGGGLGGAAGALWRGQRLQQRLTNGARGAWGLRRQIDGLSVTDEVTHLYKLDHGLTLLAGAVELCRRYQRILSVLHVGISHPEEWVHGGPQLRVLHRDLAVLLQENCRSSDQIAVVGPAHYLIVAPETGAATADVLAHRLAYLAQSTFDVELRVGIAEFPTGGLSVEELNAEAQAALAFARGADLTVVAQD